MDGTTYLPISPLELIEKLGTLVPSRLNSVSHHGVLAPNAALRAQIVPVAAQEEDDVLSSSAIAESNRSSRAVQTYRAAAKGLIHDPFTL